MTGFACTICKGNQCQIVRWCGDEYGWACPGCCENPWNNKVWRAWAAHRAEHEAERKRKRKDDYRGLV